MAELRRRDGGNLLDAHVNDGRRPKQQSDFSPSGASVRTSSELDFRHGRCPFTHH